METMKLCEYLIHAFTSRSLVRYHISHKENENTWKGHICEDPCTHGQ